MTRLSVLIFTPFVLLTADGYTLTRRNVLIATTGTLCPILPANADEQTSVLPDPRLRDRKGNKNAVIREDYWYMTGNIPPRLLSSPLKGDDPSWNAFGSCSTGSDGTNSCTYVSLKQRGQAYSKYAATIARGASEYGKLPQNIADSGALIADPGTSDAVDAELKMILLSTALLTSPNFPIPSRELLVARYYVNEIAWVQKQLATSNDMALWEYGRDAWNSYFQIVNRSITPKVGDQFQLIP